MIKLLEKCYKKRMIILLVCLILLLLFGFLIFNFFNIYEVTRNDYHAENIDAIGHRMESLFLKINDFPQDEGDDILYLTRIDSLHRLLDDGKFKWNENKEQLSRDFSNFLGINSAYYQLRYIDENGMEIIRIENDGDNLYLVNESFLQDKGDRYYYKNAMKLDKGEVYVSRLDLNKENGILDNRGSKNFPEYVPTIRYATPVFDFKNRKRGILIFNVYADYFLEDIRRMSGEGDVSFLIDNKGYYLANPNRSKEFSFMFDREDKFDIDYPEVDGTILNSFNKRFVEKNGKIFSFRYLYPTAGTFATYKGAEKIFGENPDNEYYWVLISVSDSNLVNGNIESIRSGFIVSAVFSAMMILLIVVLLSVVFVVDRDRG